MSSLSCFSLDRFRASVACLMAREAKSEGCDERSEERGEERSDEQAVASEVREREGETDVRI